VVVTTNTLVAEAAKAGAVDVDARHIGYLCRKGVLPHARRTGRVNGGWAYPIVAPLQLRAYLALRERMPLTDARFVLWIAGFPVDPALAQETMVAYLTKAARHWNAEVAKHESPTSLVETIGDVLARARSKAPIPRLVDMSLEERQRAYRWMATQLVDAAEVETDEKGALAFDRAIGRRDRNGNLYPEFEDDAEFLNDLPRTDPATLLGGGRLAHVEPISC
jgi:hypothetical protein